MNNYSFSPLSGSYQLLGSVEELSEIPQKNSSGGPMRRNRGREVSDEERARVLQEKACALLAECGIEDQDELKRVCDSLSTGRNVGIIQNYELRKKVEYWLQWEQ